MEIKNIQALFFENMGVRQTVIKNTFWLVFAEIISRFLEFILIVYIIRILGVTEFGKFTFALALVGIFIVIFDLGISDITTRDLANDKNTEKDYATIFSLKITLSIMALILILIVSFFITKDPVIRFIIWILGIFVLTNDLFYMIYSFLRARQKMEFEAGAKILRSLILTLFVFLTLFRVPSIENVSYGYLFANVLTLVLILLFFHFKIHSLKLNFNINIWKNFLKISWPLGLAAIFGAIFLNIDSVIMGYFNQITQVGYYNAARRLVAVLIIPATLVSMSFYPILSKLFKESKEKLLMAWNFYMELMIISAIPLVVGGSVLAPQIINFIYGGSFNVSILVLKILIFIAGINFLCYPYIIMLIVAGQQKKNLLVSLIVATVNVSLNLILIPRYSLYGAAVACIITYIVFFISLVGFAKYFMPIPIFNSRLFKILVGTIFSSSVMFAVINQPFIYNHNLIFVVIIGMLIYSFVLFTFYNLSNILNYESNRNAY